MVEEDSDLVLEHIHISYSKSWIITHDFLAKNVHFYFLTNIFSHLNYIFFYSKKNHNF